MGEGINHAISERAQRGGPEQKDAAAQPTRPAIGQLEIIIEATSYIYRREARNKRDNQR